jgi:DNA-binding response OmpR family regulator
VLFVEDSPRLRKYVGEGLRTAGYALDSAADGEEGLHLAGSNDYDAIVLDIMLPKMDGLTVLRRLRQGGSKTHVLLLTAKDAVEDRVRGLERGADDYLVKPFAMEELRARVQALVRRRYGIKSPTIQCGGLTIDTAGRKVYRDREPIVLRPREYALLEYLVARRGEVVTRGEIERHIYDDEVELKSNVVDSAIYQLRKLLDRPGESPPIETRRGMGYVLECVD